MIVTGEASGDLHGARLLQSIAEIHPDYTFAGMGGTALGNAGMEILYDADRVSVVGILEVISHLPDIVEGQKILRKYLAEKRPDILVIIDLPDFNLLLAKTAKSLGIPVFYYICPQIWAWRESRVKKIGERTDFLGVILPFEEDFYRSHGLDATYVGHPLLDSVPLAVDCAQFKARHQIYGQKTIGLLPGSRKREVHSLLPVFLEAAVQLQNQTTTTLSFLIPQAPTISTADLYACGLENYQDTIDIKIISENRYELMAACDCAVAASGTVTLELALLGIPMVAVYKLARLTYLLAKLLVKTDCFSLVNLIAGKRIIPELLQDEVTPERVCKELSCLLFSFERRSSMVKELSEVRKKLGKPGASKKAAQKVIAILSQ